MQTRMLSPAATGPLGAMRQNPITVNGRVYTPDIGATFDVPDFDSGVLAASGWVLIAPSGPSTSRPSASTTTPPYTAGIGTHFFDQTLAALIVFDGQTWRNPATGAAV
jgi:hypothetical protein